MKGTDVAGRYGECLLRSGATTNLRLTPSDGLASSNNGRGRVLLPNPTFHSSVQRRMTASPATLLEHGAGNNENVPERNGYRFKARFLPGQSMEDVTFVE